MGWRRLTSGLDFVIGNDPFCVGAHLSTGFELNDIDHLTNERIEDTLISKAYM